MTTGEVIALIKAFGGSGGGSSGGGVLVVHDVAGTLDKTWQEIHDADYPVVVQEDNMLGMKNFNEVVGVAKGNVDLSNPYGVVLYNLGNGQTFIFTTSSANGYPAMGD